MVALNPQTQVITKSIRYTVPSRTGGAAHVVTVDPRDARTRCTCTAGSFGRDCHAQEAVREGQAGRPIVRISQRPPLRCRTSVEGRAFAAALEV